MKVIIYISILLFILSCSAGNGNISTDVLYTDSDIVVNKNLEYASVRTFDNIIGIWEEELGLGRGVSIIGTLIQSNIESALNQSLGWQSPLEFDFYKPSEESNDRPLIIFIHGGGFIYGNRFDDVCKDFCITMSKYGYACASIDYRKMNLFTPSIIKAGYVATQDALDAFTHFVNNSENYGIDPTKIVFAGISAGAITALNCGYLYDGENIYDRDDKLNEMFGSLRNSEFVDIKPAAIINISGAIHDLNIINDDIPLLSFHGLNDNLLRIDCGVPFEGFSEEYNSFFSRMSSLFSSASPEFYEWVYEEFQSAKIHEMCGANEIHSVLEKNYTFNKVISFENQDHYLYWSRNNRRTREGDTIIKETVNFLYEVL